MTNAQNDNPSDSQSAAFGLAPCSAIYRHTGAKCHIEPAPPESAPWSLRATFFDGVTGFDFHPSRLHDWFEVLPNNQDVPRPARHEKKESK